MSEESEEVPSHRELLGSFLNKHGLSRRMVEVGCAFGGFSRIVLAQWKGWDYYLVDLWRKQPSEVYREITNETTPFRLWMNQCMDLCEEDKRAVMICDDSVRASDLFQQESLCCVYIDANHSFDHVTKDLNAWWSKVRPGGLFCGHDHYTSKEDGHYCEVDSAVEQWAARMNLKPTVTPCSSWWVRKP